MAIAIPPARRCRSRRYTVVEMVFASAVSLIVVTMVIGFVIMSGRRIKSGQEQLSFNYRGRYGGQQITNAVNRATTVAAAEDGLSALIYNTDRTVSMLYLHDSDGNPATMADNAIWLDPDTEVEGDERVLVPFASALPGEAVFANVGTALSVRFHAGDPPQPGLVSDADLTTGPGYQGIAIRLVAKPRNVGEVWSSGPAR